MGYHLRRSTSGAGGSLEQPSEEWPFLDQEVLVTSHSRKVCMTCHFFRHHAGVNCIPILTCQLPQGLLAPGDHFTRSCQAWPDDMTCQRGWCLEVA